MRRFYTILLKSLRLGMLALLALNVMVASIPRCELIVSVLQHQWTQLDQTHPESCHEMPTPTPDQKGSRLAHDRFCECSLLQYMAFHVPTFTLHESVIFRIQSERLLSFDWQDVVTDFQPLIEPPYPKFV